MKLQGWGALMAAAWTLSAQAAEPASPVYVQVGVGIAQVDLDDRKTANQAAVDTWTASAPSRTGDTAGSDSSATFSVALGLRANRYLALEAGYRNVGDVNASYTLNDIGYSVRQDTRYTAAGPALSLLGLLPASPALALYGRADLINLHAKVDDSVRGATERTTLTVGYGLGLEYTVVSGFALRLEARRINVEFEDWRGSDSRDVDSVNVGLVKGF